MNKQTEAVKLALEHAKRDERHLNHAETRYWCRMYRDIAEKAIEALAEQPAPEDSSVVQPAQQELVQCPICRAEDWPYPKCGHVTYVEHPAQQDHVVCCGEFETCIQACTPRGRFLGKREALAEQPAQHREAAVIDSIIAEHGYPKEFQEFAAQLNARKAEQPAQEPVVFEIDWPEYNSHAMGCGLEDRGIKSRYEAMQYGWDEALERMAECLPDELYTSPPAQRERCHLCDCTGDIHSPDGEWRGECPYCKQQAQRKPLTPEQVNRMAEVHAIDGDARHWFVVGLTDGEAAHGIKGDA